MGSPATPSLATNQQIRRDETTVLSTIETYLNWLHNSTLGLHARLEGQEVVVRVARVVEHLAAGVEDLAKVARVGDARAERDPEATRKQLRPDQLQLLMMVMVIGQAFSKEDSSKNKSLCQAC